MRATIRIVIVITALIFALPMALASERPPNILLILADDVGREAIGCYGGESYETPAIDGLAARGMKFEHFYSAPVCHPTRVAIISGKYLPTVGNPNWGSFPKGELEKQTIANELKKAGYATAIAGKWHLAKLEEDPDQPHRLGFDEYCFFAWHEGPRYWQPLIWQNGALREDLKDRFGPDVYAEFIIDFMKRNRDRPFFAYYSMTLSHTVSNGLDPHPPHGPKGRYMTYAEMMVAMDERIGRVVDAVEELGLSDDTLILFTSDNGTTPKNYIRHEGRKFILEDTIHSVCNGVRIKGAKKTLTDWGIRMPTIAVWPGKIEPTSTNDVLTDGTDLLSTFNEIAGQPPPEFHVDGKSFAGLLTGKNHTPRQWIGSFKNDKACVRTQNWKLLADGRLYNMKTDPDEKHPIRVAEDTEESNKARDQLSRLLDPRTAYLDDYVDD